MHRPRPTALLTRALSSRFSAVGLYSPDLLSPPGMLVPAPAPFVFLWFVSCRLLSLFFLHFPSTDSLLWTSPFPNIYSACCLRPIPWPPAPHYKTSLQPCHLERRSVLPSPSLSLLHPSLLPSLPLSLLPSLLPLLLSTPLRRLPPLLQIVPCLPVLPRHPRPASALPALTPSLAQRGLWLPSKPDRSSNTRNMPPSAHHAITLTTTIPEVKGCAPTAVL